MSSFWPTEDGWPYPDTKGELVDPDGEADDDLLNLRAPPPHLLDDLDPLERQVIAARFGLNGSAVLSMKQLHHETGLPRGELRQALGSGLAKLRTHLV
jgi:DNA-directed RNA polymerase sigma subunit (sigma70/sigma32)